MNSTLNLLPPEKRKILYNVYLLYFLKVVAELLLLYSALVAFFLIWARVVLDDNLKQFQTKTTLIEAESKGINEQLVKINETLRQANVANSAYIDLSKKLVEIYNYKTTGITLSGLDIEKQTEKFTVQGKALTRQNLLDYQKKLEASGLVKDLNIPISMLTAKENIDFEIT
ncbi:MAG: hypothetical protein NTU97_03850, partial [Candidatus Magasanikbacteria bacterium]|nr:hypothetical protein [Candidatus Magasanikbacteria bacterium]